MKKKNLCIVTETKLHIFNAWTYIMKLPTRKKKKQMKMVKYIYTLPVTIANFACSLTTRRCTETSRKVEI